MAALAYAHRFMMTLGVLGFGVCWAYSQWTKADCAVVVEAMWSEGEGLEAELKEGGLVCEDRHLVVMWLVMSSRSLEVVQVEGAVDKLL